MTPFPAQGMALHIEKLLGLSQMLNSHSQLCDYILLISELLN